MKFFSCSRHPNTDQIKCSGWATLAEIDTLMLPLFQWCHTHKIHFTFNYRRSADLNKAGDAMEHGLEVMWDLYVGYRGEEQAQAFEAQWALISSP